MQLWKIGITGAYPYGESAMEQMRRSISLQREMPHRIARSYAERSNFNEGVRVIAEWAEGERRD